MFKISKHTLLCGLVCGLCCGLVISGCAKTEEIDTRLHIEPASGPQESHACFSLPIARREGWTRFAVKHILTAPKDPMAVELSKAPQNEISLRIIEWSPEETAFLEWKEADSLHRFQLDVKTLGKMKLVSGGALIQLYLWKESTQVHLVLRTAPLFPLQTLNSQSSGSDLLVLGEVNGSEVHFRKYQLSAGKLRRELRDFDLEIIKAQFLNTPSTEIPTEP